MIAWILAICGLAIIFLSKFANRSTENAPSLAYWWNDNWVELVQGVLLTLSFMLILQLTTFENTSFTAWLSRLVMKIFNFELPGEMVLPAKEVLALLIGWMSTGVVYWLNKRKAKWTLKHKNP